MIQSEKEKCPLKYEYTIVPLYLLLTNGYSIPNDDENAVKPSENRRILELIVFSKFSFLLKQRTVDSFL